jgi:serine/tyrosine/threonine adenylyltransferase
MKAKPAILELGNQFYDEVVPARFPKAIPRYINQQAEAFLGLAKTDWAEHFLRFSPLPDNLKRPLALRYHGHQFGHYNPELGDGRGFLFAQFQDSLGQIWDLGTKGSGQTPYSRSGDGRLTLKGAVREALATELLESLGVNTSKTFCFFETGESLERNDEPSPTRAAVLTRLSLGHIRIGSFQRLAYLNEKENIEKLLRYCVRHYYPKLKSDGPTLAEEFLAAVGKRLAKLAAQYMSRGFVHGVLNSDNINISGESFDYGPYRFLPFYDSRFTAAYFDQQGYYAFGRQPEMILWNLKQLAISLEVAYPQMQSKEILQSFGKSFTDFFVEQFFHRVNLVPSGEPDNDENFLAEFFQKIHSKDIPFEQSFFDLAKGTSELFPAPPFQVRNHEIRSHSYFQSSQPCTLLIDEIENIWRPIEESDNWDLFNQKIEEIRGMRGIYLDI